MLVVQLVQRQDRGIFWLYPGTWKPTQLALFLDYHKSAQHNIQDLIWTSFCGRHTPTIPCAFATDKSISHFPFWSQWRRVTLLFYRRSHFALKIYISPAGAAWLWLDMAISNPS